MPSDVLERSQFIPSPIEDVFALYGDAANLQYFINWLNNVLNIAGENW